MAETVARKNAVIELFLDDDQFLDQFADRIKDSKTFKDAFSDALQEVQKETKRTATEQKKAAKTAKQYRGEFKNAVKDFSVFGLSLGGLSTKFKELSNIMSLARKGFIGNRDLTRTNLRGVVNLSNGISKLGVSYKAAQAFSLGFAKTMKIVKIAIASTGIGLLVVALGSLASFLSTTQDGMNAVGQQSAYLKGAFASVQNQINDFGRDLFNTFKDKGAIEGMKKLGTAVVENIQNKFVAAADTWRAFIGLLKGENSFDDVLAASFRVLTGQTEDQVEAMKKAGEASKALEVRRQALIIQSRDISIATANSRALIKQLNKDVEDTTKSYEERIDAAKRTVSIEQGLLAKRIKAAKEELAIVKEQNALSVRKDLQKQADAEIKLANLRTESFELQTTQNNKVNILLREQAGLVAKIREEAKKLQDFLNVSQGTPIDKLIEERNQELERIGNLRNKAVAEALRSQGISDEEIETIKSNYNELEKRTEENYNRQITSLRNFQTQAQAITTKIKLPSLLQSDSDNIKDVEKELLKDYQKSIGKLRSQIFTELNREDPNQERIGSYEAAIKGFIAQIEKIDPILAATFKNFEFPEIETQNGLLAKILGITDDQLAKLKAGLSEAYAFFKSSANDFINFQIERTEVESAIREDRLTRARELAKVGRDDLIEIEQEKLDKIHEERNKFVQAQLVLDKIEILSKNALALANAKAAVSAAFASAPFPFNIPAVLFSTVGLALNLASAISTVQSFSTLPAFKDGVDRLKGPGTQTSDSITARLSKDEGVLDAKTNLLRLRAGWDNKTLKEMAAQAIKAKDGTVDKRLQKLLLKNGYGVSDLATLMEKPKAPALVSNEIRGSIQKEANNRNGQEIKLLRKDFRGLRQDINQLMLQGKSTSVSVDGKEIARAVKKANAERKRLSNIN